jgi:hypothetical protein
MTMKVLISILFANDAGVGYIASIDSEGNTKGFNSTDLSSGYAHNTIDDWREADTLFDHVKDHYITNVKAFLLNDNTNLGPLFKEARENGFCAIDLGDYPEDTLEGVDLSTVSIDGELIIEP